MGQGKLYNIDYVSSQAISSASFKLGTTRVTSILDEDAMGSDSATSLATQQSIKKYVDDNAGGGISGWYDFDTGTGITAFGGAVAISGTQAETLSVADYIASSSVIEKFYSSSLGAGVSSAVYANTLHSANTSIHFAPNSHLAAASISASTISGSFTTGDLTINANTISGLIDPTWPSAATNKHYVDNTFMHSGGVYTSVSSQYISGQLLALHQSRDITDWDSAAWENSSLLWNGSSWIAKASSNAGGVSTLSALTDTEITLPASGETLIYKANNSRWENELPSMTYDIANISISANQNINLARFSCPAGKKAYVWQAYACNSGQNSVADLCIQILSGSTSVYKTSSSELQQGNPLGVTDGGNTEIRFMYSGDNASGIQYGTGMMQVSVY